MSGQLGARRARGEGCITDKVKLDPRPYALLQAISSAQERAPHRVLLGRSFAIDTRSGAVDKHVVYNSRIVDETINDLKAERKKCRVRASTSHNRACGIKHCHWHVSRRSVIAYETGGAEPIACTCEDWRFRGLYSHTNPGPLHAVYGCKHMIAMRMAMGIGEKGFAYS